MPKDTAEMTPDTQTIETDFCVIGAGAGGVALATTAAAFGQRVVLIEKHKMGGEGINYGSVPTNALLAAAQRAQNIRTASSFGIAGDDPQI
ncbi:MAG: FAD-dependent oxidoreductase, partial [Hyphomicrobium sp.]